MYLLVMMKRFVISMFICPYAEGVHDQRKVGISWCMATRPYVLKYFISDYDKT